MKSRVPVILTLLVMLLSVSCGREKGLFILSGTVQDDTDTILVVGLDSRFQEVDTIVCHEGAFEWIYRPDTVTTLIMVLPPRRADEEPRPDDALQISYASLPCSKRRIHNARPVL